MSEWAIKFNGLSRTAESEVHVVHISLSDVEPLPEPTLPSNQLDTREQNSVKFESAIFINEIIL